tara:strand:- start:7393 stop:8526 length:1134 start_codon:yes stop_codon:yes gene_type:complete
MEMDTRPSSMTNPSFVSLVTSKAATAADLTSADVDEIQLWGLEHLRGVLRNKKPIVTSPPSVIEQFSVAHLPDVIQEMETQGYEEYLEEKLKNFFGFKKESYKHVYKYTIYDSDAKRTLFEAFEKVSLADKEKNQLVKDFRMEFNHYYKKWNKMSEDEKEELLNIRKQIKENKLFLQDYIDLDNDTVYIKYNRILEMPNFIYRGLENSKIEQLGIENSKIEQLSKTVKKMLELYPKDRRSDKKYIIKNMKTDEAMNAANLEWKVAAVEYEKWLRNDVNRTCSEFSLSIKKIGFKDNFTRLTSILDITKHQKVYIEAKVAVHAEYFLYRLFLYVLDQHLEQLNCPQPTKFIEQFTSLSCYKEWESKELERMQSHAVSL